jgi:hypothetical protein
MSVRHSHLLHGVPQFHLCCRWFFYFPVTIKAGPADSRQLAHSLDAQSALRSHPAADLGVDAFSPFPLFFRTLPSILRKALSKKSNSNH